MIKKNYGINLLMPPAESMANSINSPASRTVINVSATMQQAIAADVMY